MRNHRILGLAVLCVLFGNGLTTGESRAADKAQIQQAIARGTAWIKAGLKEKGGSRKSLANVALLKVGEPHDGPYMVDAAAHVLGKIKDGVYQPSADQIYEAALDITLLADLDGEKYLPQIQIIANYLIESQSPQGHWNYLPPRKEPERTGGDVSVSHYACLGLWAAARAGVKIDPQVWVRVLNWMSANHNADGGYAYNPGVAIGLDGVNSTMNMTVNGVGILCIAMLNLEPQRLPAFEQGMTPSPGKTAVAPPDKKAAGAIEAVNLDAKEAETAKKNAASGRIPDAAFTATRNALNWVSTRFEPENKSAAHKAYYYYSLERMGALANVTKLNNQDWYNACADKLISVQNADGSWTMSTWGGPENDTCFAVLFLTRSTGKILKRTNIEPPVGGGLLSAGRGLPDDLKDLDASGNVKKKREKSSLDDLLASLQNSNTADLEETQSELVQQIQLGDKKELIGKKDMLIKLVASPDAEVRRTAIWAIGRTGDLSLARFALRGLDDPDSGVMRESHLALCWTARKPNAFKLSLDPLESLPAEAGPDQKSAAVESWRRQALRLWGDWYLRNRPYAERGDEFETNLRNRLLELQ